MGNIFAIRPGMNNTLAPIALGSHLDTQPSGGKYDGILGVVAALEVLQTVVANNIETYAPLAIVNWTNEEGARFQPSMLGSGVWSGAVELDFAQAQADAAGITVRDELQRIGYLGDVTCSYDANPLLAHLELHIEQAPELDKAQQPVAVVQGVQGIRWLEINITGRRAHAGTTAMDCRSDPLLGAAQMIAAANDVACDDMLSRKGVRATVAVINSVDAQSMNTILGQIRFGLDLRAPTDEDMEIIESQCRLRFEAIAARHNLHIDILRTLDMPALRFDPVVLACIGASAKTLGCHMELISGAGHDSAHTSKRVPSGMVFARCRDGISHNPAEYTRPEE
jgi:hydantoinase/carbamoylase family amidase